MKSEDMYVGQQIMTKPIVPVVPIHVSAVLDDGTVVIQHASGRVDVIRKHEYGNWMLCSDVDKYDDL